MEARSLADVLDGKTAKHRDSVCSALGGWEMIFDGQYKLVLEQGSAVQLYDLQKDPYECTNIADQQVEVIDRLRACMSLGPFA